MTRPDAQRRPLGALFRASGSLAALCAATLLTGCRDKESFASVTAQSSAETQGGLIVTRIVGTAPGEGSAEGSAQLLARGAARLASTFAPQGRPLFAPVPWKFSTAGRRDLPLKLRLIQFDVAKKHLMHRLHMKDRFWLQHKKRITT